MKEDIVDPVGDEDNLEGEVREQLGPEVTVVEIEHLQNDCVSETEDNLNMRLL